MAERFCGTFVERALEGLLEEFWNMVLDRLLDGGLLKCSKLVRSGILNERTNSRTWDAC